MAAALALAAWDLMEDPISLSNREVAGSNSSHSISPLNRILRAPA